MARQRTIEGNTRVVPLNLEADEYDKFVENLPRKKSVSEAIREYIKAVNEEAEKQKNVSSPNYSPIRSVSGPTKLNNNNTTLDIYLLSNHQIVEHIDKIDDIEVLARIENKGRILHSVARNRKLERIPIEKLKKEMSRT